MKDYRIFVGAFPGGDLSEQMQTLRMQYDVKTARITPPHVTLAGTYWREGPAIPANEVEAIRQLEAARPQIQPFNLILGGIQWFSQGVTYLDVAVTDELLAVRTVLLQALGQDKHRHFIPHLTLAMRLSPSANQIMQAELRQSHWHTSRWTVRMEELRLMQRGRDDPAWRTIHYLQL